MMRNFLSRLVSVIRANRVVHVLVHVLPDDTVMRSPLTRTALSVLVLPFCYNDTTPDCNLPTKEVSQCTYSWELCLFSDYSPKLARGHLLFSNSFPE